MKRVLSLMLTLAMIFVLAVPCFAAEAKVEPRSSATKYVSDSKGNRFKVTGSSTISGYMAIVVTSYTVTNYAGGDRNSINNITMTMSTSASVYFSNGTTPNYTALTKSGSITGKDSGSVSGSKDFTAPPSSMTSTHTFATDSGVSKITFSSGTLA